MNDMRTVLNKIICPCCEGSGVLTKVPFEMASDYVSKKAKNLKKAGFSLREIAEMLGYKYPNSIVHLLNKK